MTRTASPIHLNRSGRDFAERPIVMTAQDAERMDVLDTARRLGLDLDAQSLARMDHFAQYGFDAAPDLQPTTYAGTIGAPVQFLQNILPGWVHTVTQAMQIDDLIGRQTVGNWEDEEIVQGALELTGLAIPYTDYGNIPLSSYNPTYNVRTIVRFEEGLRVGKLEAARTAKQRLNSGATKRVAAQYALDFQRNRVGFYGYNAGTNRTYGFLNDPNLTAYLVVPNGAAASPLWTTKTYNEIVADITSTLELIRTRSGNTINPNRDSITLALPPSRMGFLGLVSSFGNSVGDWLSKTYPNVTVKSAMELEAANGGANVMYAYPDKIQNDGSDDGGAVWAQMVPTTFKTVGVEQRAKEYVEDYSNALAGVMAKRPFAIVRRTGI